MDSGKLLVGKLLDSGKLLVGKLLDSGLADMACQRIDSGKLLVGKLLDSGKLLVGKLLDSGLADMGLEEFAWKVAQTVSLCIRKRHAQRALILVRKLAVCATFFDCSTRNPEEPPIFT